MDFWHETQIHQGQQQWTNRLRSLVGSCCSRSETDTECLSKTLQLPFDSSTPNIKMQHEWCANEIKEWQSMEGWGGGEQERDKYRKRNWHSQKLSSLRPQVSLMRGCQDHSANSPTQLTVPVVHSRLLHICSLSHGETEKNEAKLWWEDCLQLGWSRGHSSLITMKQLSTMTKIFNWDLYLSWKSSIINSTHQSVFTGFGEFYYICEKKVILKPFCGPRRSFM